ncbi:sugar ABC transporter substrate-binding protein [Bosea caraganae]|uniref:Sugar ABC transporter substrate-binding protein n=1 Tax=Bosea caraganae TaxID=2763117 RepID=A0A370L8I9_9HYPH|nr:sugar ABC transporter substrate-binding protein [Bosea caraganae]RDJ26689.1 sugar ABC transporter substrate-binding protein [Bosea caraganae]RDJ30577.1 sugar ABC transporter substrate-binding protein [Bosea caraganae]
MTGTILKPSRRALLRGAAALGAAGAIGSPMVLREARAQAPFNWKRFSGTTLDVLMVKNPRSDLAQSGEKEFTELTGIKVSSEQVPEQQQRQKAMIEFASGKPSFDVSNISLHVQKRLLFKGKWMEDLRPYIADASLTAPDFDFADFGAGPVAYARQADGSLDTLPTFVDYWVVYYNRELFDAKGVSYPKTMEEIATVAAKLHDPAKGIAGFVSRGLKNANVPVWTSFVLGQGVETVSPEGKLLTDTPEAIWGAELYKKLNKDSGPAGAVGFNWNECQTTFMQGRAAMWLDGIGFATPLEDPSKSRIVGKVGYGIMPPGPKAHYAGMFADGIGISRGSQKKQAAWLYIQFMTSKARQAAMLRTGAGAPARSSPYLDKELIAQSKFGKQYFDCLLASAKIARAGLPQIVPVTEFRDVFGVALTNALGGADVAAELKKATETFAPVLAKSEQG